VPISLLLTGLLYFINLYHFGMLDLIPVARDIMVEKMNDGVLVMDGFGRIVDMNPAAQELSGVTRQSIGKHADEALRHWPDLLQLCYLHTECRTELRPPNDAGDSIEIQMTALRDYRNRLTGRVLVLRDVSQRYHAEQELRRVNERLQEQLREIEALQVKLREQAIRDGLTNLFNRRYLEEWLEHELVRADRERYSVAVLVMDLDFFKQINDTYGHLDGDLVLQAFAQLLVRYSRMSDLACRYGGEEFILVLPGMDLEHAAHRAEQIRSTFQALPIQAGNHIIQATVSAGIGVFPQHGSTLDDLLRAADDALYQAKADGRNCVRVSQGVTAQLKN
jgi:diguanylate cyclase (GGDEF)-like protein/PAS domain S-box-containing protein